MVGTANNPPDAMFAGKMKIFRVSLEEDVHGDFAWRHDE